MGLEWLVFAAVGALAGTLSGLLGISGGMVTVPCLLFIFEWMGFPKEHLMQMAIGTSLASMVINACSSTWAHHIKLNVKWDLFKSMLPGVLFGSICGAFVAYLLPSNALEIFFGVVACGFAVYMWYSSVPHAEEKERLPNKLVLNTFSFGIAAFSNILGIGGGIMTVPVLLAYRVPMKKAVGTSAATTISISLVGAISYLYLGRGETSMPLTFGYLYLPAFAIISVASIFGAFFGTALSHRLPVPILKKIFAGCLLIAGLLMMF